MIGLLQHAQEAVQAVFSESGFAGFGRLDRSRRPDLGQFQCNDAMAAAKEYKRPPREIAEIVCQALLRTGQFSDVSVAGPGFINLSLRDTVLAEWIERMRLDPRAGCPTRPQPSRVVIDFGGPNVAKAMHVGHLRSSIIGDCLQRLFRFAGDEVTSDIHLGDWGLPMGMLICELRREQPDLPYFNEQHNGPYPDTPPVAIDDLERMYPQAAARCKDDEGEREAARQATALLQDGHPGNLALWRHFIAVSTQALRRDFDALGVSFDLWHGESSVNERVPRMIERLRAAGAAQESRGALVVPLAEEDDTKDVPPLMLVKSEGGQTYGTTDLATIEERMETLEPDVLLYVVDQRQSLHFEQVFRAARKTGIVADQQLEHIGFGTVNGPDGRPFKTRAGGVMRLGDLITMALEQARQRLAEAGLAQNLDEPEREEIARCIALAAVKFADLRNDRLSDYVFNLDTFTSFEGKTGPYMQYAAVRIDSLLAKAAARGFAPGPIQAPGAKEERDLMLALTQMPEYVMAAHEKRAPHLLCDYVYQLAGEFNSFYQSCHILSEEDTGLRDARLALCELTKRQLALCLSLLGIEIPQRM